MFEAKNVLIREQMMRAFLPCGKGLYMRRDRGDMNKFETLDEVWKGYLINDGDDFVVWRDDGWKLLYHKGKLASITSDDNHKFTWNYDTNGVPTGLDRDGQSLITIELNPAGQASAFVISGKRYELSYAQRPITEMLLGQVGIRELDQALASFKYPDGKIDAFHFELTPQRIPTVTFSSRSSPQTLYTWDPATQYISAESGPSGTWSYTVKPSDLPFGVPQISRASSDHKTETISIDTKEGIYTRQLPDGSTLVTRIFESPGPLYQKVRSVDKVIKGKTITLYKNFYDESGTLIRQLDARGFIETYLYDSGGHRTGRKLSLSDDPVLLASLAAREKELMNRLSQATAQSNKDAVLNDLYIFYIGSDLNYKKAAELLPLMSNSEEIYNLRLALALNPDNPTTMQKEMLSQLVKDFPNKRAYTELHMTNK